MNSRELMKAAMRREPIERIPTMPQICYDLLMQIYGIKNMADKKFFQLAESVHINQKVPR